VVGREFTTDKATDFMAILTSLKAKQPEAIFYGGYAPQAAPMARQMKQLGINAKLLGGDTLCSPEMPKLGGDAVNDAVYCAYAGMLMDNDASAKAFQDKFKKRFGQNPDVYGPFYYDQVMNIGEAMQKSGSIDPAKVGAWMHQQTYKGVMGEYAYDDKGNRIKAPIVVMTFEGGKAKPLANCTEPEPGDNGLRPIPQQGGFKAPFSWPPAAACRCGARSKLPWFHPPPGLWFFQNHPQAAHSHAYGGVNHKSRAVLPCGKGAKLRSSTWNGGLRRR
jgi:hypothetical protein